MIVASLTLNFKNKLTNNFCPKRQYVLQAAELKARVNENLI